MDIWLHGYMATWLCGFSLFQVSGYTRYRILNTEYRMLDAEYPKNHYCPSTVAKIINSFSVEEESLLNIFRNFT